MADEDRPPEQMTPQQPVLQPPQGLPGVPTPAPAPPAPAEVPEPVQQQGYSQQDIDRLVGDRYRTATGLNAQIEAGIRERNRIAASPPPIPPTPSYQNVQDPPDTHPQTFKQAMPGLIFSTVMGAMMSRRHGMDAMNAAAGYLEGFKIGDKERMDRERQKWIDSTDALIKNNNINHQRYSDVLNNRSLSVADQQSRIAAISAEIGDRQMQAANQNGAIDFEHRLMQDRQKANTQIEVARIRASMSKPENMAFNRWYQDYEAKNGQPPSNELMNAKIQAMKPSRSAPGKSVQSFIDDTVAATGAPPSHDDLVKFEAERAARIATAKITGSAEARGYANILGKLIQQQATIRQFENTAIANGKQLLALGDKVDNTGSKVINSWIRHGKSAWAGNVDVTNFDAQMAIFRGEVAKIVYNPNLTGVLTVHAQQEAEKFLNAGETPQTLRGLVTLFEKDFKNRQNAINQEIEEASRRLHGESEPAAAPAAPAPAPATVPAGGDPLGLR